MASLPNVNAISSNTTKGLSCEPSSKTSIVVTNMGCSKLVGYTMDPRQYIFDGEKVDKAKVSSKVVEVKKSVQCSTVDQMKSSCDNENIALPISLFIK